MARYTVEVEDNIINFFREKINNSESIEIMLSKMIKLLQEILIAANL